jgi:tRNA(Arg) A34 adenosine deaminase TadA
MAGDVSERSELLDEQDLAFLRRTVELAARARSEGRHPFGALIANAQGQTIVEARNNAVRPAGDPTQHAEMLACRAIARKITEAQMAVCTLYTSTEPCAMCAGAIYWVGIGRVVYALSEQRLAKYTGPHEENPTLDLPCREVFARGQRRVIVAGPAIEDEAGRVHEGFWTAVR